MEKILEFLNENGIDNLKLGEVVFEKSKNELFLTFLCAENEYENIISQKANIEEIVKKYVNLNISYCVKIIKAFLDEERFKSVVKNFLKASYCAGFYSLKKIEVEQNGNSFFANLHFALNDAEIEHIRQKILEFLNNRYFYDFQLECFKVDVDENNLEEHKNQILSNLLEPVLIQKMKVNKVENIIGEVSETSCYPFEYYKNPEENIFLCGHLEKIEEIEFTKKDGETKGIRYALTVKCLDKIFNASFFPSKKNLEIAKTIQSDVDIIMQGSLDNFNNNLSFKVKSLAKCAICEYEKPKKEINREYNDYRFIHPKEYVEINQANFFDNFVENEYLQHNEFVVFDLETTGIDYKTNKVTEIGAVKIKNGKIVETFSGFVNPQRSISAEITRLTGITNDMVKDAPLLEDVLPDFFKFTKNAILVGQNVQFDFGFIDYYSRPIGYLFTNKMEDTMNIAKKHIFLRNYKLKTISEALNVPLINAHRAINDAMATAKVFIKLIEKFY
ncbi:MAG: PolC-type DNA polymerase III [Christensenellales bacterium]